VEVLRFVTNSSAPPHPSRAPLEVEPRPIRPADAPAWAVLYHAIAEEDGDRWRPTPVELSEFLEPHPAFDPERQTWSVWDGEQMVAFASAHVRLEPTFEGSNLVYIAGGVHPRWRGRGLGTSLFTRAQATGADLAAQRCPGIPATFHADTTDTAPAAAALLEDFGFAPARYWFYMTHDLSGAYVDDPRTQAPTPGLSEAIRLAHNDAFATHWGSGPVPADVWDQRQRSSTLRPDLSRIIVRDGQVLAYAIVSTATPGAAYFNIIGVRGAAQGRGLGRAVVTSALAAIQAEGTITEANLDVDADNPTGAGALYSSAGFVAVARTVTWQKLPPG